MEKLIAFHCAPALAGIKTANIVSVINEKYSNIPEKISELNESLNPKGIRLEALCSCRKKTLLMVYRPNLLEKYLKRPDIHSFLAMEGYPVNGSLDENIEHLKSRLQEDDFPHEIGAFLGYPIEDIYGFIHHKDDGLLFSGDWKVYANEEDARKKFARFSACRCALIKRLEKGQSLSEIFRIA